jgi:hypothetical protein
MQMTYPLSSQVSAGQPTAADHYNNLRKDALSLGQSDTEAVNLGTFLKRFASGIKLEYLANHRVRVPHTSSNPPTLMINGYMLQANANVDLPAGLISGPSATWFIFAVRSAGSNTFTLTANTSSSEGNDFRLIGQAYWTGSVLMSIQCYLAPSSLPPADYDSGWFACTYNTVYNKPHGLGTCPRLISLYHSIDSAGTSEWVKVTYVQSGQNLFEVLGCDSSSIYIQTGTSSDNSTCYSSRRLSSGGFYRVFAWA